MAYDSEHSRWRHCVEQLVEESPDGIGAGFPCQDISFAGEGAGLAGSRSGLVWALLRTIRLVRPRRALLENVAALLSRGLGDILGHMAEVGYDAEWHCIPASAVGAPHQRDRIWIIATDAGSEQHEGGSAPLSGEIAAGLSGAVADTTPLLGAEIIGSEPHGDHARVGALADAEGGRRSKGTTHAGGSREGARADQWSRSAGGGWWLAEPDVGRVADGVPARVDRLRCLGNAVVPQVVEAIGRALLTVPSTARDEEETGG